ncbi:MAG TPA: beta-galactosidase [Candidatus Cybelea sp.]|nr:beta-galactosidase [Candidatus Cybelea sp.]
MRAVRTRSLAFLFYGLLATSALAGCAGAPVHHRLAYDGSSLSIDGQPVALSAAQFHYWQLPAPQLWPDAFGRMKAAGYNAVALDLYWGYHAARPGTYDFGGIRDLDALFDDAARAGLYVVVQPGPYIDAGADASGLPDWLLARTASRTALNARYLLESREWFRRVDAIVARHQLSSGTGTIVLDEIGERDAARTRRLERAARKDGVTVPFSTTAFAPAFRGVAWGWTSATAADPWPPPVTRLELPAITHWRSRSDDDEISPGFNDQAWPPLLISRPFDSDDLQNGLPVSGNFFGVDDYGFHHGAVWYRGRFVARGTERALGLAAIAGRGGACAVWLNGFYLGSVAADPEGIIRTALPLARSQLRRGRANVIAVLFESAAHAQDANRDTTRVPPRGMLRASLSGGARTIAWRILANGEFNIDAVRGPLAAGGLAGEIAGWQNPQYDDRSWAPAAALAAPRRAGVTWYRATVPLDVALPRDAFAALHVEDARGADYRASIFVNGWLIAHYAADARRSHTFPVPAGPIDPHGDNTIAIAVWRLKSGARFGKVSLTTVDAFVSPHLSLPDVPVVRARDGTAKLRLAVASTTANPAPHFVYDGADAAPTIRVHSGDWIDLTLRNELPRSTNTANNVNLHFHGLNVAPLPPGDDVLTTLAAPGTSLHYRLRIPTTQPRGLYWYHPHAHGETYWQVTSGMAGAIVVEGLREKLPLLHAMGERTIVVRDVQYVPNIMAIPWYARKKTPRLARVADADDNPGPNASCLPEPGLHLTLNGIAQPQIALGAGQSQLFRVLNATASRVLDLAVDNEQIGVVALDGYPADSYPGNPAVLWTAHVVVPPGARAEFIVTGLKTPTLLRTRCYDSGAGGDRDPQAVLATITQDGALDDSVPANARASSAKKAPRFVVPAAIRRRTIVLSEDANGFYINGRAFSMTEAPAAVVRAGTLEEWTLLNKTDEVHDIHLHQVHFLVESLDGRAVTPLVWRDTVLVPVARHTGRRTAPGVARLLVDFRDPAIRGTFVFHCHMLDHEDGGMMATIKAI